MKLHGVSRLLVLLGRKAHGCCGEEQGAIEMQKLKQVFSGVLRCWGDASRDRDPSLDIHIPGDAPAENCNLILSDLLHALCSTKVP